MRSLIGAILFGAAVCVAAKPLDEAESAAARGDYPAAVSILEPLAAAGDVDALGNLGNMYAAGHGVPRDLSKAADFWRRAAEKGLGSAMGNLAQLYGSGLGGLAKDQSQMLHWLSRAAEHRHVPSMLMLSEKYGTGAGVEKDMPRAIAWGALAMTNARDRSTADRAHQQTKGYMQGATKDQLAEAQALSDELVRTIDANVAKYKAQ